MNSNTNGGDQSLHGETASIWMETTPETSYEALEDGITVDVAVVGGGIAGITAAAKLKTAGQSVAVIERDRLLTGVTGYTTAKLTSLHGLIYGHLIEYFGEEQARQYAEANEAAIDDIESTVEDWNIDCNFERVPAYTYTESSDKRQQIEDEVDAAKRLGLPASVIESTDLPFDVAAVKFDDQAHFHPRKYLLALAQEIADDGSYVFENTTATNVEDGQPCTVSTEHGKVTADHVVVATHFPVFDKARYYERLSPKRSYVLAVRLADEVPEGMYYEPEEPYFSVRPHPAGEESMALVGGQSHRTGHGGSTVDRYRNLEQEAHDRLNIESIEYRWSTQDFVSVDRVPFIGRLGPQSQNVYTATGFGGWGMTNGTVAGIVLSDMILDRENPWQEVYQPMRFNEKASSDSFRHHNEHDVKHYLEDYSRKPQTETVESVAPDEAMILEQDSEPTAVYRDEDKNLHAVSAVCTHMGCLVSWNDGEQSWDCPCHGSRFDYNGEVLDGPANSALSQLDLEDES
ncbi:FAD-dependent oxidoreductase [Haladaptatus salinisoli]|uniref:FAD-dependent oxidoreductase n=1 Tax=Haladaptatus salinisoli TaxID=2884876 RepID=UPI001D0A3978|nr:FAD-dependent oxidoreductase [Haladaptatus salinisoli]